MIYDNIIYQPLEGCFIKICRRVYADVAKAAKGVHNEQKKNFRGNGSDFAVIRIGFGRVLPAY
jgi:hypothetical protein